MQVLVLNTGSSSVKFELFEVAADAMGNGADSDGPGEVMVSAAVGRVEGIAEPSGRWHVAIGRDEANDEVVVADHATALGMVIDHLRERGLLSELAAVGHRVVHGGEEFTAPTVLDDEVVAVLRDLAPLAPLHNPPALVGIEVARDLAPAVPHVAVFDTAFHQSMPPVAHRYAVPTAWYEDHGVRRFGFHGTSHEYVFEQACAALGRDPASCKVITLHLGNGASATAVDGGTVVDTSMGLSPMEGLVMGTRSGDIDPGVVFHMVRAGLSIDEVERALNRQSGLLGLAGANDMRTVAEHAAEGDADAELAIAITARRLRGYIGAYLAHLGDLDALVFTAGIGEHDADLRAEVVAPLAHFGFSLDPDANELADAADGPVMISKPGQGPAVLVVATAEEWVIARAALAVVPTP